MYVHETLRFIGAVVSLTGVLTIFLVGMVFADLWAPSRRTNDIINAREERMEQEEKEDSEAKADESDPFLDTLDDHDTAN